LLASSKLRPLEPRTIFLIRLFLTEEPSSWLQDSFFLMKTGGEFPYCTFIEKSNHIYKSTGRPTSQSYPPLEYY
jgi:hypothetical protein